MYKHILVAVDTCDTSYAALKAAITLAKQLNAKLRILHVANEYFVNYLGANIGYEEYETSVKEAGQALLSQMSKIASKSKVTFDTTLVELKNFQGRIEQKIIEAAQAWPADLLVIGSHGRRGFHHFLLGSVSEGVTRISPIPVLLIRAKPTS
ncbi:MAG: universal stress protein [Legionellales bacterium]|nr:universal stress protein [Legionellales bacterium]